MDNKTIIRKYITQHYQLVLGTVVRIEDKYTGQRMKQGDFIDELDDIFGYTTTDICNEWYDSCLRRLTKDLHEYLDKYRVLIGSVKWEIRDNDDNEFDIRDMVSKFEGNYEEKFIRALYNDWKINKIFKKTEELMKLS